MAGQRNQRVTADGGAKPPGKSRRVWVALGIAAGGIIVIVVVLLAMLPGFSQPATLQNIVMTTGLDLDGAPVDNVTEYPLGTRSFICSFYYSGSAEALEWEWYGPQGLLGERQREVMTEEGYYWVRYDHPEELFFSVGNYKLLLYLPDRGDAPVAEVSFSVVENPSLPIAELDAGSLPMTAEAWTDLNDWLMTFTEGRLAAFEGELPPDSDLIDFAVRYNYFYNEDMYETLDDDGVCWLTESALRYTLWWFLDAEVDHGSTNVAMYEGGRYGYKAPEEAPSYVFPQVRVLTRQQGEFIAEFDVYTAPVGFSDFNGEPDAWEVGENAPAYLGRMRARFHWVTEEDTRRRVLTAYEWIE